MTDQPTRYLTTAETAKLVRVALKAVFPGIKFRVRSRNYANGSSIDVSWTDGPTIGQVDRLVNRFQGADFDGMQDLKTYRQPVEVNGKLMHMGADFIFTGRALSDAKWRTYAEAVAARWGIPCPERDKDPYVEARREWFQTLVYQESLELDRLATTPHLKLA